MPDWLHVVTKSIFAIIALFIVARLLGKKQISQLTFFEYIVGITIGDLAGVISLDMEGRFMMGIIALTVWFAVPWLIEYATLKSAMLRKLFEGTGRVMIKEGKVLEDNLKRERYSSQDLMEQLRTKNVFRVADVEFAMLEASGELSVMLKKQHRPITAHDLGLRVEPGKAASTVIEDGEISDESLAQAGFSRDWLATELEKIGVAHDNVFLGEVDSYGQLYVDLYDDKLTVPTPTQKPLLLAVLKKCEADLTLYALATNDKKTKTMYEANTKKLTDVINRVTPLLRSDVSR